VNGLNRRGEDDHGARRSNTGAVSGRTDSSATAQTDATDLETFGYKQELHRTLGLFSSFAAAFSYISPSTGIFTLFAFGWSHWVVSSSGRGPVVAIGQLIICAQLCRGVQPLSRGRSVFQWTKYLAGRPYAWFTGWIYIFAGILTVTAVVVTLPLTILPALYNMGWHLDPGALHDQIWVAAITLVIITVLNIFSLRLVSLINNTGRLL